MARTHAMGTELEVSLRLDEPARGPELVQAAFDEVERVEQALSHYRPSSEISRINRRAGAERVTTDPEVFGLLRRCLDLAELTGGAFDVTVGALMAAWGFDGGDKRVPGAEALRRARRNSGFAKLDLDSETRSVRFAEPGLRIDLGAIGKGYALDRAARVLRRAGVQRALLVVGGSTHVALGGEEPGRPGWPVTIPLPGSERPLSEIRVGDQALSTSAVEGRFFEAGGRRYGHVLDPRSGRPVEGQLQASVLAPSGESSDALATALLVRGDDGGRWLRDLEAAGLLVTGSGAPERSISFGWPFPIRAIGDGLPG